MSVMSQLANLAVDVVEAVNDLADGIPDPKPKDPTDGSKGLGLLISYAKWGVLIICAVCAVASGGYMAAGSLSNRPDSVDKGKRALLWSLGGVLVSAIAIPVVNSVFSAAS